MKPTKPRAPTGWTREDIQKRNREVAHTMLNRHLENIEGIDRGEPPMKFWGHSSPAMSREYSEKQVAYWTAYMMLGHSPNDGPDEQA